MPGNYILLGIFTVCEAWVASFTCIEFPPTTVFVAAVATVGVVVGAFFYALFCEIDFNWVAGFLFASLFGLIFMAIFSIFYWTAWMNVLYTGLAILIFSIYIMLDLYLIIGKDGISYSKDDYIVAALTLYIDIMRLFLEILIASGNNN